METFSFGEKAVKIDLPLSKAMLEDFSNMINPNDCFSNVYRLACHCHLQADRWGSLKVAYGFVSSQSEKIYCAHAFFIDPEHGVVDPTLAIRDDAGHTHYFLSLTVSMQEYFGLIVRAQNTDLRGCPDIHRIMDRYVQEAFSQGILCIG